jgi:diadenylate cyclase
MLNFSEQIWFVLHSSMEIAVLWIVFYRILLFFEGTRAFQVLKGISYLTIALMVSQVLRFDVLNWLLGHFFSIWIIVIVVVFQHELRAGLARLGQQHLFSLSLNSVEFEQLIDEIADAIFKLSTKKTGCLIAIERQMKLNIYTDSGIQLDAKVSSAFLQSIFNTSSPLHDGGVVIQGERVAASSCLFPLSENPTVNKTVGTRHRAALGLSEQSDAVVILVSEETTDVSIAFQGVFYSTFNKEDFIEKIKNLLEPKKDKS